ncbi:MAG: transglycosylase domain-containing protein [Bacteroidales bacterium]
MKHLRRIAPIVLVISCLLAISLIIVRNKVKDYISTRMDTISLHGGTLRHSSIELNGLSGITVYDFTLISPANDTVIEVKKLSLSISALDLICKKINLKSVSITDTRCNIITDSTSSNLDFLIQKPERNQRDSVTEQTTGFTEKLNQIVLLSFRFIPNNLNVDNLNIHISNDSSQTSLAIKEGYIHNGNCNIPFSITHNAKTQQLLFAGQINKSQYELEGILQSSDKNNPRIILAQTVNKSGFFCQFEKLKFDLNFPILTTDETKIMTGIRIDSLICFQERIAKDTIIIPGFQSTLELDIFPNEIILTPASEITLGELTIHPHILLRKEEDWQIGLYLDETNIDAQVFIDALPNGLFNPIKTVHLSGLIDYHFLFEVDLSNPDSLRFESNINTKGFKIIDPGVLTKMNQDFTLPVYEDEQLVRTLNIGNSNPDFRTMQDVSPLLLNAILQSEDGQFFYHKGFRPDAIREALIHDIKTKRFARGGSTISMQIVKNVFLNRNKTVVRKLEEALIVWLIETNRITSKQRMFDIYLNIAEWGPGIYGVKEASEFYFRKDPSQLTLDEAIFMASIIPRPKKFIWSLDDNGQIRESLYPHFRIVRDRLERNNIIAPSDSAGLYIPQIHITGAASAYIRNHDIVEHDTLNVDFDLPF